MALRRWLQIGFQVSLPHQDLLIGLLASLEFTGFLQEDHSFSSFLEHSRWTPSFRASLDRLLFRFRSEFPGVNLDYSVLTVHDRNWNSRWEQSIGIVEATKRILVKPSWRKSRKRDKGKIVLTIDPKMSFGTGHHESTRLCLVLTERYLEKGMRVLDMGSGTGILAIAAAKLGARSAIAVDNDPWAIVNARENVRKNRVEAIVRVVRGDLKKVPKKNFDMILSNIDLPTLLRFLPGLTRRLRDRGILVLSGLLSKDLPPFLDGLQKRGMLPLELAQENEWAAVALVKANAYQRH